MKSLVLLIGWLLVGDADSDAAAALALANAKVIQPKETPKAYVLFVGIEERPIGKYATVRDDNAYERAGVYWISGGKQWIIYTDDVIGEIQRLESGVQPMASPFDPFSSRNKRRSAQLDRLQENEGSLPSWFPKEAIRYESAKYTQTVANGTETRKVSRSSLEKKWNVPGGLVDLHGWKSELYKLPGYEPDQGRKKIGVFVGHYWQNLNGSFALDSNGNKKPHYQSETAYQRKYPDGAWFADVLRNDDGNVFEIRVAEKYKGDWDRFIQYQDKSSRPIGYVRPSVEKCVECHSEAGTGTYSPNAWVPGGDTIISDPYKGLED